MPDFGAHQVPVETFWMRHVELRDQPVEMQAAFDSALHELDASRQIDGDATSAFRLWVDPQEIVETFQPTVSAIHLAWYLEHAEEADRVDEGGTFGTPEILVFSYRGRRILLDGNHRMMRARLLGTPKIQVALI